MGLINNLKVLALIHGFNNMSVDKIVDLIEDYQRKEFKETANRAILVTGDKIIRIGLELKKRGTI